LPLGVVARSAVRQPVRYIIIVDIQSAVASPGSILPHVIEADVGDNTVNPAGERALETETAELLVDLEKYLLVDILRVARRSGEPKSEPQNCLIIDLHQLFKSRLVPALRLANQKAISATVCAFHHYLEVSVIRSQPHIRKLRGRHFIHCVSKKVVWNKSALRKFCTMQMNDREKK
jgi:hypothetical protein